MVNKDIVARSHETNNLTGVSYSLTRGVNISDFWAQFLAKMAKAKKIKFSSG